MTYRFAGFLEAPNVGKPPELPRGSVWRAITQRFVGVGLRLPSLVGESPEASVVNRLAEELGFGNGQSWLSLTYDCWGGEIDFVYGLGSRGGVPFGPLTSDENAKSTYTELMHQFGIPEDRALDFEPFRRGFWGET